VETVASVGAVGAARLLLIKAPLGTRWRSSPIPVALPVVEVRDLDEATDPRLQCLVGRSRNAAFTAATTAASSNGFAQGQKSERGESDLDRKE
jgi:hypothetical protein